MPSWSVSSSAKNRSIQSSPLASTARRSPASIICSTSPNTSAARPPPASRSQPGISAATAAIPSPTVFATKASSSPPRTRRWCRVGAKPRSTRSRGEAGPSFGIGRCRNVRRCHHPRRRVIQYSAADVIENQVMTRSTGCPAFAGHDSCAWLLLLLRQEARADRTDRLVLRACRGAGFRRRRCCRRGRRGRRRTLFAIGGRRALVELPLLHLLGALLGDDDVTLLLGRGLVVGGFERVGPGLARRLAGAGRVELAAEF